MSENLNGEICIFLIRAEFSCNYMSRSTFASSRKSVETIRRSLAGGYRFPIKRKASFKCYSLFLNAIPRSILAPSRKYDLDRRHPACKNTLQVACRKILKNGSCVRLQITCVKLCLYIYKNSCFVNSTRCTTRHVFRDCVILKDAIAFFLSVERLYQ